jgi:hypothetical protein
MNGLKFYAITIFAAISFSNAYSQGDPKLTEFWTPVPKVIVPGNGTEAPSDAIVLFDGKNLDEFTTEKGQPAKWEVKDGIATIVPGSGSIITKKEFADCQIHVEWRSPSVIKGEGQGRGNSGLKIQRRYELQVMDSYNNPTYTNGQAGSVYKQTRPLVNACRKPGEWQTYDIVYTAPRFNDDGTVKTPAYITVLHNGVLVQNHTEIKGTTEYIGEAKYKKHPFKQPLLIQEHGNPVSYRNIWIREINEE